ncbi:MAG TPA: acyl carrier protein [Terriglobales bacterium]|nr:acyl carrier protein [Terriglobales bacterium]
MKEEIRQWLCDWFASRGKIKGDTAGQIHVDYFEAGLLTSLEVIEFVSEIEERFGVSFSEQDFQDPRFVTIAGLAELVAERSPQQTTQQTAQPTERP